MEFIVETPAQQRSGWRNGLWLVDVLELLALGVWIGGLVMIMAAVIPAVFNSMGMEPAGHFLRRVFDGYNVTVVSVLVVLAVTGGVRFFGAKNAWWNVVPIGRVEAGLLLAALLVTILIVAWLGPRAIHLQELAFAAEPGTERKAAYDEFFRWHMIVRALHMLNWGLAVSLFVVKVKNWRVRPRALT